MSMRLKGPGVMTDSGRPGLTSGTSGTFDPLIDRLPSKLLPNDGPLNEGKSSLPNALRNWLTPLATMPPLVAPPPGVNRLAMLKAASPTPRPGWSPVSSSQAMNSLPTVMRKSSRVEGSWMIPRVVSPMAIQVSTSASAIVPATELISPVSSPTRKSM
ncbi:hypothetical protein MHAS44199_02190 [Mycolicibacterium hassiacum DSM 44199]|nr:hypothetical protein [Mycolicibacterium hassiacum DSM 44199]